MSGMYHLPPVNDRVDVQPCGIMYHLPSYHGSSSTCTDNNATASLANGSPPQKGTVNRASGSSSKKTKDSEQKSSNVNEAILTTKGEQDEILARIQAKQLWLIDQLKIVDRRLDVFIQKSKANKPAAGPKAKGKKDADSTGKTQDTSRNDTEVSQTSSAVELKNVTTDDQSKMSKKAESKVEKKEKKKQDSAGLDVSKGDGQPQKESAPPSNSPKILYASLPATSGVFPVHDYRTDNDTANVVPKLCVSPIQLLCNEYDLVGWVPQLAKVGANRGVNFVIPGKRTVDARSNNVSINVSVSPEQTKIKYTDAKSHEEVEINGAVPVWKFLGTLLGVYSAEDSPVSTTIDSWLLVASKPQLNTDQLSREMARYLARHDFFSDSNAICLADFILGSFFPATWTDAETANAVQLWIKRMDESLAHNGF
ncbi:hypothetical protein DdX_09093 [Ditylenchus destructor]|uniref:Uncharacterized protein n=1 Tax=Ditylenchus destructor TaxID=166010 RepID=A0AAD4N0N2_9BILA|nr:hypothetical protein DdX_09093 [Ditylenchus destructor]